MLKIYDFIRFYIFPIQRQHLTLTLTKKPDAVTIIICNANEINFEFYFITK